ncbi:MAG: hypothetical protein ACU0C9_07650 [Paracoccaceae bacterium]
MQLFKSRDAIDSLLDLLEKEHAALLGGKFDILQRLSSEKSRLIKILAAHASRNTLEHLRLKIDRNQDMLQAASRGIKAATRRLKQGRIDDTSLQTYDSSGQRLPHQTSQRNLERRA